MGAKTPEKMRTDEHSDARILRPQDELLKWTKERLCGDERTNPLPWRVHCHTQVRCNYDTAVCSRDKRRLRDN